MLHAPLDISDQSGCDTATSIRYFGAGATFPPNASERMGDSLRPFEASLSFGDFGTFVAMLAK
jgi:hypothetical protein